MAYKGPTLSVGELIAQSQAEPPVDWAATARDDGLRWTVGDAAAACAEMLSEGEEHKQLWRFAILQTLDVYSFAMKRRGVGLAARVFDEEPPATGSIHVDAAFAALAAHLAQRDGWTPQPWVSSPARSTPGWYVADIPAREQWIKAQTPPAFAARGVWIAENSLDRA
jgi:hypothetical protein